jgi:hypothetical protein
MRRLSSLAAVLAFLLCLSTGCTDAVQPDPPPVVPPVVEPPAPVLGDFPALSRPGEIYNEPGGLYSAYVDYHGGTPLTRYVLYQDGTFGLQFLSPRHGFHEFSGQYSRTGLRITLTFDGANTAGPWLASGILSGDSMAVEYNLVMGLADFIDGVYVRPSGTQ